MTPEEFRHWLELMKAKGLIQTELDAAKLLGRKRHWLYQAKVKGTNRAAALACAALLRGIAPFASGLPRNSSKALRVRA